MDGHRPVIVSATGGLWRSFDGDGVGNLRGLGCEWCGDWSAFNHDGGADINLGFNGFLACRLFLCRCRVFHYRDGLCFHEAIIESCQISMSLFTETQIARIIATLA